MFNSMMTKAYCTLIANLAADDERGIEAVEWIAMAAAILILLTAVSGGLGNTGESLGQTIVKQITDVVKAYIIPG